MFGHCSVASETAFPSLEDRVKYSASCGRSRSRSQRVRRQSSECRPHSARGAVLQLAHCPFTPAEAVLAGLGAALQSDKGDGAAAHDVHSLHWWIVDKTTGEFHQQ